MTVSVKMLIDIAAQAQAMADAAQAMASAFKTLADDCAEQLEAKRAAAVNDTAAAEPSEPPAKAVAPTEQPTKKHSITEVRAFVAERSKPENRARIKAILKSFGVSKLTELSEDQYEPLMKEVAAL